MIRATLIALLTLSLPAALPAVAQQVPDQATAKRMLFSTRNSQIVITRQPFLSAADLATLQKMPKVAELKYYGALAASPAEGLQSAQTRGAFNFHSIEDARAAALSGCGASCVLVAEIYPRRYQPGRPLTLSQDASRIVNGRDFRRAGAECRPGDQPGDRRMGSGRWRSGCDSQLCGQGRARL